jgi:di- and tripeptidase
VTDDKGPILATLFAVSELYENRKLPCNVTFVIEGEEESGSLGFREAVELHKVPSSCMV